MRLVDVLSAASLFLAVTLGPLVVSAVPAAAAGLCATPGGAGAGGTLGGVVNTYYPGVGTAAAGATSISVGASVGAPAPIAAGDLLLVIQMQAADINSTNTNAYGDGVVGPPAAGFTARNASGLYEYVRATSGVTAGAVGVSGLGAGAGLLNSYTSAAATGTSGQRSFQVVRVPQYTTATTSSTLTAAAWNGSAGGVLAVDTTSTLTLNGTVSVDGLGFRPGLSIQRSGGAGLANTDVAVTSAAGANGTKGEGIAGAPSNLTTSNGYPGGDTARGAPGNGGGGGTDGNPAANDQNSGGGGGGNGGAGGLGGNTWSSNLALGGYGGVALSATAGRVFLGGGGGAGTDNNHAPPQSNGAPGGGLVLIRAGTLSGAGTISANGAAANNTTLNDGGGGGGAGGTIVLTSPSGSLAGATLTANGGRGGDAWVTQAGAANAHGPGGGGGGGWILTSSAPTAASVTGGAHGVTTSGSLQYGSTDGSAGQAATVTPASIPGVSGGAECADLSITKTGPASVTAGSSVAYALAVANAGPSDAAGLSVTDTLPAGVTFVSAAGTGWTCTHVGDVSVTCARPALATGVTAPTITVVVTAPGQAASLSNTASVSSTTADPNPANNSSSVVTAVTASADLSITKSGPATALAGGNVSYSLVVVNNGPSDAVGLSVTDTLPAGVTFVSAAGTGWTCTHVGDVSVTCARPALAAGATASTITVVVTAPGQAGTLVNTAAVISVVPDPDLTNNTGSATTAVGASADLSLVKTGPATVTVGAAVTYRLSVTNSGPDAASAVQVVDTLPTGVVFVSAAGSGWSCSHDGNITVTCSRATLANGAVAPRITVVLAAPGAPTTLTNHARVFAATVDRVLGNNASSAATAVLPAAGGSGGEGGMPRTGAFGLVLVPSGLLLLLLGVSLVASSRRL